MESHTMTRRLCIATALLMTATSGCVTHSYSSDPASGAYLNDFPQYFPPDGDFPLAKEAARAQAPDRIEPIPADESKPKLATPLPPPLPPLPDKMVGPQTPMIAPQPPVIPQLPAPPRRGLRERIAGLFGSSKPSPVPVPMGVSPQPLVIDGSINPVQLFPASPSPLAGAMPSRFGPSLMLPSDQLPMIPNAPGPLPPSIAKIVPPGPVAAPTPEQLNAISKDLVKAFQKDAFDPNVTPAAVTAVPMPSRAEPSKANALDGTTWVRDNDGCRVVLKFVGKRVAAEMTTCIPGDDGKPVTTTGAMAADYTLTDDGRLFGMITDDLEIVVKPKNANATPPIGRAEDRLDAPFAARVRIAADTLTIQSLRTTALEPTFFDDNPDHRTLCLGKYAKCGDPAKLPAVKPMSVRPAALTPERIHGGVLQHDDFRRIESDWRNFWLNDMPSHIRPVPMRRPTLPETPRIQPHVLPFVPESMPLPRVVTVVPAERPTLSAVLEFLNTIIRDNPAAVTAFSAEAGRGLGQWLGKKIDRPELGAIVGGILGSTLGAKLTDGAKQAKPTTIDSVSYWLGVK